jgi:hypothetical protein
MRRYRTSRSRLIHVVTEVPFHRALLIRNETCEYAAPLGLAACNGSDHPRPPLLEVNEVEEFGVIIVYLQVLGCLRNPHSVVDRAFYGRLDVGTEAGGEARTRQRSNYRLNPVETLS